MKKIIRKNDIFLFIGILICAAAIWIFQMQKGKDQGTYLVVKVEGKVIQTYSLNEERQFWTPGKTNLVSIHGGKVSMGMADCPDQICVNHVPIYRNHESIICLPNNVVLEIASEEEPELDTITN